MTEEEVKEGKIAVDSFNVLTGIALIKMLSGACMRFKSETTDKDELGTTAGPYATSGSLHQTHMQTESRERETYVQREERTQQPSPRPHGSASRLVTCLLPASLRGILTCCTCLIRQPRGPALLIQFQRESAFEARRRNPKPSLSVLCVPD